MQSKYQITSKSFFQTEIISWKTVWQACRK